MSGGVDNERDRVDASRCSGGAELVWASWGNIGWLDDWVGVVGGVERPEAVKTGDIATSCMYRFGGARLHSEPRV